MGLNGRQKKFVNAYLKEPNGTKAAISAGYSKNGAEVQAHGLLRNPKIKAEIDKAQAKASEKAELSAAWVLSRLKEVALRCMQQSPVMKFDPEDRTLRQETTYNEKGEEVGLYEFDSSGANRALELIGKSLSMFNDKNQNQPILINHVIYLSPQVMGEAGGWEK